MMQDRISFSTRKSSTIKGNNLALRFALCGGESEYGRVAFPSYVIRVWLSSRGSLIGSISLADRDTC